MKWLSSPTTITASGFFKLDFALIGLVLSITVTYWTLTANSKHHDTVDSFSVENITWCYI
ncbi:hypothetical protein CHUAL_001264 [Chamberlinius hualienensis]